MKKINTITLLIFMFSLSSAFAQAPSWSVNPNQYQYSMTVTAVLDLNCVELNNPSNQLAAYVGDSIRGTAFTSSVIGGRYQASMTVYSDVTTGEIVKFRFYDQSSNAVYFSIDSIAFQDNAIYGNPSSPLIIRTNNRPDQIQISNDTLLENQTAGITVGSFSTTDIDVAQSHSYSLVAGTGGTDNASFSISGMNLIANITANFENKTSYAILVRTTDTDGCTLDSAMVIHVKNVNDPPTAVYLSSTQVDENNALNDVIGNLSALDSDLNETFTYSLVAGAGDSDNASFNVAGNDLRASSSFNFEVKDSYALRVQVTDGSGNTFSDSMTVLINNINESPTDVLISSDSLMENMAVNSIVGTFTAVDEDFSQSHSFTFDNVPGNNNSSFNIVGNSLRAVSSFDFETLDSYFIYVLVSDFNGGSYTKQLTIRVINANDLPSDIQASSISVNENQPVGTYVGSLITTDQDTGSAFTYSLVAGVGNADNAKFMISNDSILTNAILDVNVQGSFDIRISTNDGSGGIFSKAFTITANDVNNAPSNVFLSNNNVPEVTVLGSTVGTLTTADADLNNTHIYTLVAGLGDDNNSAFNITGADFKTDTVFNVNLKSQYSVRIRSTDNQGLFFERSMMINIVNSNDAPTNITLTPDTISENSLSNSLVGLFSSTDPDSSDTHTYTFANLSANDNASFAIVGNELRTSSIFDFETKPVYFVQIQSTDAGGDSYSKQLVVNVIDSNDTPTDILLNGNQIDEKQSTGVFIGLFSSVDQDVTDSYTYSFTSGTGGNNNASFGIIADSLFSNASFDFIANPVLSIRVRSTDAGSETFDKVFVINVQDVNDNPNDLFIDNNSIPEDININTLVGVLSSADIDPSQSFTYTLVAGTGDVDNSNFSIQGSELKTNVLFDYNNQRVHSIRVKTTDQGGLGFEKNFLINISNTNDAPSDIVLDTNTFNENLPQSTIIASLSTVDKDSMDVFSYSFMNQGSNDNSSFIISGNQLRTAVAFDYETKNLYIIEVQSRDNGGLTYNRQITLNVLDSNDTPIAVNLTGDSLTERSVVGSYVADINTADPDASETFTYALVAGDGANDNALFRINGNLLEVDSVLLYNDASVRRVRIQTTDKGGETATEKFVIRIINENDNPTAINLSDTSFNETAKIGDRVAILSTTDEDQNDTFIYSLEGGSGDDDNNKFSILGNELVTNTTFDFETEASFTIRLRSTDGAGANIETVFNIVLLDGNEKPEIENQQFSINENQGAGFVIGTVEATDSDANETLTFRILNNSSEFEIDALSGELRNSMSFDYEINTAYTISVQVMDALGLSDTAEINVGINDEIEGELPAAGYFSPNGDGINDTWKINNVELYSDYKLTIYSINGQLIYESGLGYKNDWDGTISGNQLPEGVFYYLLIDSKDSSKLFKGTITLKR